MNRNPVVKTRMHKLELEPFVSVLWRCPVFGS